MLFTIMVLDECGEYYENAKVENEFDAIMICNYYRKMLGYDVKLFRQKEDISFLLDSVNITTVKKGEA